MGLVLGWLRAVAQGYNYNYNKIELGKYVFSNEFTELWNNIEFGLGWLRAVAQGYNYSYNKTNWEVIFKII